MCGLAGLMGGTLAPPEIEAVLETLRHRGPDDEGTYSDDGVTFLHTRLSIIDLSATAGQPMHDSATGVTLVFNGEIYNYRELRQHVKDDPFRSQSDTEVILRLYLREGLGFVGRLRGMFCWAIWDPRSRSLHLARDRFGIKPLFYHYDGYRFRFASEIKGLLAMGVPPELNQRAVHDYLCSGAMAHTLETFFQSILSVEPGTVLSFHCGNIEKRVYWSWPAEETTNPRKDPIEETWHLLQESVRLHRISDVPVGISLSSGLDSQCLLHLLSHQGVHEIRAFTFGYEEAEYDEIRRCDHLSYPLSVKRTSLRVDSNQLLEHLERAVHYFEAPLGGVGTLSAYFLMRQVRKEGIKVLLSGEGADEIFGGYKYYYYPYFRDLYEEGRHDQLQAEVESFNRLHGDALTVDGPEFRRKVLLDSPGVLAPDGTRLDGQSFISPELETWRVKLAREREKAPVLGIRSHLRRVMYRDSACSKLPKLLWFQDRASMASGIEIRVPFLDHPLVEYVWGLPEEWVIRHGVAKYLLRRVMERFAGVGRAEVLKHYVATPQREWLKGPLYETILSYMQEGCLRRSGLIDYEGWRRAYERYVSSPILGNSFFVWRMVNLEAFLRIFREPVCRLSRG